MNNYFTFCNHQFEFNIYHSDGNYTIYSVIAVSKNPILKALFVFTSLLVPFPKEIKQLETQYVQLFDSHYFLSPYRTVNQKTIVKLASNNIESFTKLEPFTSRGSSITFGPYKEISAFQVNFFKKI